MIREVGKTITISKYVETDELVTKEKINSVSINMDNKILSANVALLNADNRVIEEKVASISGENYDLLFSDAIFFGEGKQQGSYREVDLWKMIDKVSDQT